MALVEGGIMSPLPPNSLGPLTKPFGSRINSPDSELRYASVPLPDGYGISHQSQQILQCVHTARSIPLLPTHWFACIRFRFHPVRRIQNVADGLMLAGDVVRKEVVMFLSL